LDTARQAGRILESWNIVDSNCFNAELESALMLCETEMPSSELECEQQAVLESVVRHFRQVSQQSRKITAPQQFEAGFFLLRHLRSRAA
jgi:hypothetical protein